MHRRWTNSRFGGKQKWSLGFNSFELTVGSPSCEDRYKGIEGCFRSDLIDNVPKHDQESLAKLFEVKSSVSAWLR